MRVRIYTPVESVLAGRVVEVVRSAAPDADVRLTTDPSEYAAIEDDGTGGGPGLVSVVVGSALSDAVFDGTGPTVAVVPPGEHVPDGVPRVVADPDAPEPALAALRTWIRAVAEGGDPGTVEGIGPGTVAGAAAAGGLAGFLLGGLFGDDGDPPFGGDLF